MARTANICMRVDPEVKEQAESILGILGIQLSNAFNMFLHQIILRGGLPFDAKVPENKKPMNMRPLTPEELSKKIGAGYKDMQEGKIEKADDVFNQLFKEHNQ